MDHNKQKQIFEAWLSKHRGLFFKFVRAYAYTPDDQDDLFQEVSLQIWRSIPNFRGDSAESTWIYRVAMNTSIAWTKKERKHTDRQQSLDHVEHLLKETDFQDSRLDWLYGQIAKLNEIDKALTVLLLDGFSYKEMSNMLGISESNVGVKINRIKKRLIELSKFYQS